MSEAALVRRDVCYYHDECVNFNQKVSVLKQVIQNTPASSKLLVFFASHEEMSLVCTRLRTYLRDSVLMNVIKFGSLLQHLDRQEARSAAVDAFKSDDDDRNIMFSTDLAAKWSNSLPPSHSEWLSECHMPEQGRPRAPQSRQTWPCASR